MDVNKIMTPVMIRLLNDKNIPGETTLGDLLNGVITVYKGPRKPTAAKNPCFTIHVLTAPMDPDTTSINGTLIINFYHDNYSAGNAAVEKMGPVADRVVELFHDRPLSIDGYCNYNLAILEPLGPLYDPSFPDEHFMSIRIRFNIVKY